MSTPEPRIETGGTSAYDRAVDEIARIRSAAGELKVLLAHTARERDAAVAEVDRLRAELAAAQTGWTDWSEGLGNDGIHEWSPAYECSGEFICAWRRTPAVSRKAGQWERQDVMPDNLSYPEGAS